MSEFDDTVERPVLSVVEDGRVERRGGNMGGAKSGPKGPWRFTNERQMAYLELIKQGTRRIAAARAVGVSPSTVAKHMKRSPEFAQAVDEAELEANEQVERALFDTAIGGNVIAQQVWLYNRMPERWADKRQVHQKVDATVEHRGEVQSRLQERLDGLASRLAELPANAGEKESDDG